MGERQFRKMSEKEFTAYMHKKLREEPEQIWEDAPQSASELPEEFRTHIDEITAGLANRIAAYEQEQRETHAAQEQAGEASAATGRVQGSGRGFGWVRTGWRIGVAAALCVVCVMFTVPLFRGTATRNPDQGSVKINVGDTTLYSSGGDKDPSNAAASAEPSATEDAVVVFAEDDVSANSGQNMEEEAWAYFAEQVFPVQYGWQQLENDPFMFKRAEIVSSGGTFTYLYKGMELMMQIEKKESHADNSEPVSGTISEKSVGKVSVQGAPCEIYGYEAVSGEQGYMLTAETSEAVITLIGYMDKEELVYLAEQLETFR